MILLHIEHNVIQYKLCLCSVLELLNAKQFSSLHSPFFIINSRSCNSSKKWVILKNNTVVSSMWICTKYNIAWANENTRCWEKIIYKVCFNIRMASLRSGLIRLIERGFLLHSSRTCVYHSAQHQTLNQEEDIHLTQWSWSVYVSKT